jgi:hypothetical protein
MAAKIEANHAWLESVVYQANKMNEMEFMLGLGGPIAGLKGRKSQIYESYNSYLDQNLRILC